MNILLVEIHVKPEHIEAFKEATLDNVSNSLKEPGIVRFDFLQQSGDAARFHLIEVYRDEESQARHKETAHYARWRLAVTDMMAEPRVGTKFTNLFPGDETWKKVIDAL